MAISAKQYQAQIMSLANEVDWLKAQLDNVNTALRTAMEQPNEDAQALSCSPVARIKSIMAENAMLRSERDAAYKRLQELQGGSDAQ